jgi:hypothetical protein
VINREVLKAAALEAIGIWEAHKMPGDAWFRLGKPTKIVGPLPMRTEFLGMLGSHFVYNFHAQDTLDFVAGCEEREQLERCLQKTPQMYRGDSSIQEFF